MRPPQLLIYLDHFGVSLLCDIYFLFFLLRSFPCNLRADNQRETSERTTVHAPQDRILASLLGGGEAEKLIVVKAEKH